MKAGVQYPVDLDLEYVLGSMPRKVCLSCSSSFSAGSVHFHELSEKEELLLFEVLPAESVQSIRVV